MALSVFAAAAEAPDRAALVTDTGTLTYHDLGRRVRGAIHHLRGRGLLGPEPVALVATVDVETLVTLHALLAVGTPALLLHPRHTAAERDALVEVAGAAGRVEPDVAGNMEAAAAEEGATPPGSGSAYDSPPPPPDERPLAIIPTSGTTGRPRGVILSRRAFAASAAASAANLGWRDDDRWLLPLPIAHVGGLSIVTRCLLARRPVVLAGSSEPETLVAAIRRHRVTLVSLVPTLLSRILDLDGPGSEPPDSLRAVLLGGAAASPALLSRAVDQGWPVLTTYGLSEACSQVTTQPFGAVNRGELGSGPPLPGVQLRIGDDDMIQVRGPTLFSGYVPAGEGRPVTADGWLITGDRGRLDDAGNLHVLGRRTDRIITGGENVDPLEVEAALTRLPGVAEACVFGVPDEEWGEVVCAALVADPGASSPELLAAVRGLRTGLAAFKVPRRVALVAELPRNANGKVDRRATASVAREALRHL